MFDHVHLGWLASDDYREAAQAAGVVELPDSTEADRERPSETTGPFEPDNAPGSARVERPRGAGR